MKPYGKKPAKARGAKTHSSDDCGLCSNRGWKKSKTRERNQTKNEIKP